MRILSHRGWWLDPAERNGHVAFQRSIEAGFGTETDVRDRLGELVVAHDPADREATLWQDVIELFRDSGLPMAVNVKADGIGGQLARAFAGSGIDWFAFDMSAPETVRYAEAGMPFYTRHSDVEPSPILYEQAVGVWLDDFGGDWIDRTQVERHLVAGKQVCIVSSELHGRDPEPLWTMLQPLRNHERLSLCTDRPAEAKERLA